NAAEDAKDTVKDTEKETEEKAEDAEKDVKDLDVAKDEEKPFSPNDSVNEDSPEVKKSGKVLDMEDNIVGYVDKRLAAKFAGYKVNADGDIIDHDGEVVGSADMIQPEEEEDKDKPFNPNDSVNEDSPEVRKSGKIVDMEDNVVGTIDKEKASKLAGFKVNKDGEVIDNEGHIVAKAKLFEQEEKPFNPNESVNEDSPEVRKSGKVFDMDDNLVGYVDKKLAPKLAGFKVDDQGNVINNEGHISGKVIDMEDNIVGHVDKKLASKFAGFKVNDDGDIIDNEGHIVGKVVDEDDNIVGTVDKSIAHKMVDFPVDDDGNIINPEGHIVGKAQMIKEDKEPKGDPEEEEYRKIADQMSTCIQQSLDKIKPILKRITETIDEEEAKPQKERDEQKLVDTVKPLIEQGSQILEEANGAIRGLDPTGRIAKKAQSNTSNRKASPEEYHLADLLAQLSGEVTTTIDRAKKKIRNMPHAKKELSPLWNILQSPLLQILSAVGLLLTGVLGLVGNILNGLGLGSIVNSLLGGIGLNKILEGFGLGDALNLGRKKN
ncbi:hypothetical protein CU098_011520, partial [Rhizopus stolonifer]